MSTILFKIDRRKTRWRTINSLKSDNVDIKKGSILLNNKCATCNSINDPNFVIECSKCESEFHTTCLTYSLPTDFIELSKTNPCVWWCCTECMIKANDTYDEEETVVSRTNDAESTNQVDLPNMLSESFNKLKADILKSVNESIDKKIDSITSSVDTKLESFVSKIPNNESMQTFADAAKKLNSYTGSRILQPPTNKSNEVVIISPTSDGASTSFENIKETVTKNLKGIQISFLKVNDKSKKIAVGFPDPKARDEGIKVINKNDQLESLGYAAKNSTKMLPKIIINYVPSDILDDIDKTNLNSDMIRDAEKQHIVNLILDKNPCVQNLVNEGHTLNVVFLNQSKFDHHLTIAVKTSPAIRTALIEKQRGAIYIANGSYQIKDRYHYIQCYHCQLLGHISGPDCPNTSKSSVCLYCMGKHKSKECQFKRNIDKHCCAKCYSSNYSNDADNYRSHNAASPNCPVLIRELKRLESNTDLTSKNVM